MTRLRNDQFDPSDGFERGRSLPIEAAWYLCKVCFFLSAFPWPSSFKCRLLRWFGARIGRGVVIKPRVNIHFPWKLSVGDHSWIGEESWILNFEPVQIGAHCCISQRAFLCAGSHDYRSIRMRYRNSSITIGDGAWIAAQVFVAPGVTIGEEAVAVAGSIVVNHLPAAMVCAGNPCRPVKTRWASNPELS